MYIPVEDSARQSPVDSQCILAPVQLFTTLDLVTH